MKKKYLAILLTAVMLFSALAVTAQAKDIASVSDGEVLTVTANGQNPTDIPVGKEFVVFVGLKAGEEKVLNGQVQVGYDSNYVSFVPHTVYSDALEEELPEGYCFPNSINKASIVFNYSAKDVINYNFSIANGVAVFNDTTKQFARFIFKAEAAGTTDISYIIQYMINTEEQRIFYNGVASDTINPSINITISRSKFIGDVNADGQVNGADSAILKRYVAKWDGYESKIKSMDAANINRDGQVNGADAALLARYVAKWTNVNVTKYFE